MKDVIHAYSACKMYRSFLGVLYFWWMRLCGSCISLLKSIPSSVFQTGGRPAAGEAAAADPAQAARAAERRRRRRRRRRRPAQGRREARAAAAAARARGLRRGRHFPGKGRGPRGGRGVGRRGRRWVAHLLDVYVSQEIFETLFDLDCLCTNFPSRAIFP